MECKCGGYVRTKSQPKVKNKKVVLIAELDVCNSCGRNAGDVRIYQVDHNGHKEKRLK